MILKILGGVAALALGLWLGRAGRYTRTREDVEQALGRQGPRQYTKRMFTPLDLLRKKTRASQRAGTFTLKDPTAVDEEDDRPTVSIRGRRRRR